MIASRETITCSVDGDAQGRTGSHRDESIDYIRYSGDSTRIFMIVSQLPDKPTGPLGLKVGKKAEGWGYAATRRFPDSIGRT